MLTGENSNFLAYFVDIFVSLRPIVFQTFHNMTGISELSWLQNLKPEYQDLNFEFSSHRTWASSFIFLSIFLSFHIELL